MCQHAYLPAMMRFVSKHVAQHLHPNRPRPTPAISAKHLDAPLTAERFSKHLPAASRALRQSRTHLSLCAAGAVQLDWNLQVRSRQPHPLRADIVHVRKYRRNRANFARWLRSPHCRVKMFEKHLVHALIGSKDPDRGSARLGVSHLVARVVSTYIALTDVACTRGHG